MCREVPKSKKQLARELEEKQLKGLKKSAKKDLYSDDREEKEADTMDSWDQAKLEDVRCRVGVAVVVGCGCQWTHLRTTYVVLMGWYQCCTSV